MRAQAENKQKLKTLKSRLAQLLGCCGLDLGAAVLPKGVLQGTAPGSQDGNQDTGPPRTQLPRAHSVPCGRLETHSPSSRAGHTLPTPPASASKHPTGRLGGQHCLLTASPARPPPRGPDGPSLLLLKVNAGPPQARPSDPSLHIPQRLPPSQAILSRAHEGCELPEDFLEATIFASPACSRAQILSANCPSHP